MPILPTGTGALQQVNPDAVGAGVIPTFTVPARTRWRVLSCRGTLTADATVATRTATLVMGPAALRMHAANIALFVTATATATFVASAGLGVANSSVGTITYASLPDRVLLAAGDSIYYDTVNMQAGDVWTLAGVLIEEWIEP